MDLDYSLHEPYLCSTEMRRLYSVGLHPTSAAPKRGLILCCREMSMLSVWDVLRNSNPEGMVVAGERRFDWALFGQSLTGPFLGSHYD